MRIVKVALLTASMVLLALNFAWADWSGTAGDQKISYFPGYYDSLSQDAVIVAYGDSNLYAAWIQGKATSHKWEVYFSKSTDNGRTWTGSSADYQISNNDGQPASTSDHPVDIAVNSLGHIFVVWADTLPGYGYEIMLLKSTDGGETWIHSDADFAISNPGGNQSTNPAIAIDGNDGIHVVWQQIQDYGYVEICYGYSSDGGDTWTSQTADRVISFPDSVHAQIPDIAVDGDNNVHVVWKEQTISGDVYSYAVHYGRKLAAESEFSSETQDNAISIPHRGTTVPSIATGPGNSVHVAYQAYTDNGDGFEYLIFYTGSFDGGDTWTGLTTEHQVDDAGLDSASARDPEIVAASTGDLAVVYAWEEEYPHREPRVSISTDNGATWSGNTNADYIGHWDTEDNRPSYNPSICISAGDTLHVVWHEDCNDEGGSSGYYEIMYSRGDVLGTEPQQGLEYVPGDANMGTGQWPPLIIGGDVTYMVGYFRGINQACNLGTPGFYCSADANGDCLVIGSDVTKMVTYFRGLTQLSFCPDYEPLWLTPDDAPENAPAGWPNCQ